MTLALGTVRPGSTITIVWNTFDSNDPSVSATVSDFVLADIGIYKSTSMTERGSTTGVVLLDTDGIDIDSAAGIGGFTIDLSSNATDDFYTAGSRYYVTVGPVTVDAGTTVNFVAATFEIGYPGAILDAQIATLASQTSFTITNAPTDDSSLVGCSVIIHDQASATQFAVGYVSAYTTAANTITLKADPGIFTMAAGDNVSFFMPANVQAVAGTTQTALNINDILVDTGTTIPDILKGLVLVNGTIGATGNTTTKLHLDGLTYGNDEINGWTLVVFDNSTSEYHQCLVTDWVLSTELATVEVSDGSVLPFTPEASVDKYWLVTPATTNNVWDRILNGTNHNVAGSSGRRLRGIQEFQGYALGAVWIDTVGGTAGTVDFENGTVENPVSNIGDANTIASSIGLNRFVVAPNSSITFAASQENQEFLGRNWTLALGGQSISNSHFSGADVSGTATGATEVHFDHCEIGTVSLGISHIDACDLEGDITFSAAGTYHILSCYHAGAATIDFGDAVGNTTLHMHDFHGAITIKELGSNGTDVLHFSSSDGKLTLDSTCVAGTVNLNGTFDFVNSGSGMTINQDGRIQFAVGDQDASAAVGDPSASESVMQYIKQLVNAVLGSTGIVTMPAAAAPANNVSLTEMIRAIYDDTNALPVTPKKNVALSNVPFKMVDATDHVTPETGRTITGTISKDGGAFSALTNAEAEIASGWYKVDVTQTEMNADVIILKFTASGADQTEVVILTDA